MVVTLMKNWARQVLCVCSLLSILGKMSKENIGVNQLSRPDPWSNTMYVCMTSQGPLICHMAPRKLGAVRSPSCCAAARLRLRGDNAKIHHAHVHYFSQYVLGQD